MQVIFIPHFLSLSHTYSLLLFHQQEMSQLEVHLHPRPYH